MLTKVSSMEYVSFMNIFWSRRTTLTVTTYTFLGFTNFSKNLQMKNVSMPRNS